MHRGSIFLLKLRILIAVCGPHQLNSVFKATNLSLIMESNAHHPLFKIENILKITKNRMQSNKLKNHTDDERFRMQERRRLLH